MIACFQAKYIAQLIVTGAQVVGRAFARAVKQEITASQAAAAARQKDRGTSSSRGAASDALTGMTVQVIYTKNPGQLDITAVCHSDEFLFKYGYHNKHGNNLWHFTQGLYMIASKVHLNHKLSFKNGPAFLLLSM